VDGEIVLLLTNCHVLSFDYKNFTLKASAPVVLVLTRLSLYLFAADLQSQNYDKFSLDQFALVSLLYEQEHDQIAQRSEDLALHLHDFKTLWIRFAGDRSQFVQLLSDSFTLLCGSEIEVNSYEHKELLQMIVNSAIHSQIMDLKISEFVHQPAQIEGWLEISTRQNSSTRTRWCSATRHDLWHFSSPDEQSAFKFAYSLAKSSRAKLPPIPRIPLLPSNLTINNSNNNISLKDNTTEFILQNDQIICEWIIKRCSSR
jgi:hypothetical protein